MHFAQIEFQLQTTYVLKKACPALSVWKQILINGPVNGNCVDVWSFY